MKTIGAIVLFLFSPWVWAGSPMLLLDDFEQDQPWEVKEWGDWARLSLDNTHPSQGSQALLVQFDKAAGPLHPKGIVLRRSLLGRAIDYEDFVFDIFVKTSAPLRLDVSVEADFSYQGPSMALQPGWNKGIRLSLLAGGFQAWDEDGNKVALKPEMAIGSLILSLHRSVNEAGSVSFDNIQSQYRPELSLSQTQALRPLDHGLRIKGILRPDENAELYQPLEWTVTIAADIQDPYDADEFELKAVLTSPEGKDLIIPGFLYSGRVSRTELLQDGVWKIRFTPTQEGAWTYAITAKNRWQSVQSERFKFQVKAGKRDGFVRLDPKHPRYFSFDAGGFYYPIGQNVAWLPLRDYERYFDRMAEHGENWARIWMTNWSFGIEWKPMGQFPGLGFYNLDHALKLDKVLQLAEASGLYLQLVFDYHGAFSSRVNPEWSNNPYNSINGGFLTSPEQFFTDPRAQELYKKRLRYILARWGYSPHVMAWEFFNEVGFTDKFNESAINSWHQEMAAYIKQMDPYQHLTTTSYGGEATADAYQLSHIDFAQQHVYTPNLFQELQSINSKMSQYKKAHFIGEFGSDAANGRDDQDRSGVTLHTGIWTQFMHASSGNAMPWWWDSQIEPNDLYYHFSALARFAQGLDRRQHAFKPYAQTLRMGGEPQPLDFELVGLQSPDLAMFWLCDSQGLSPNARPRQLAFGAVKISLQGFQNRLYDLEFWDTYKGELMQKAKMMAKEGRLTFELPRFNNDIAFKIRPRPSGVQRIQASRD